MPISSHPPSIAHSSSLLNYCLRAWYRRSFPFSVRHSFAPRFVLRSTRRLCFTRWAQVWIRYFTNSLLSQSKQKPSEKGEKETFTREHRSRWKKERRESKVPVNKLNRNVSVCIVNVAHSHISNTTTTHAWIASRELAICTADFFQSFKY